MRAFRSALLVCLAVVALVTVRVPAALALPAGSYQSTCRDAKVQHGRDLSARCETGRPGELHATRLKDFAACRGDIENHKGTLRCARPAPAAPPGLALRQTCTGIKLKDGVLSAYCRARNGLWHDAALNLATCRPGGDIWNHDGALACEPRRGFGPPPGSYRRSCRNAVMAEGWLTAECRDGAGQWQATRIDLPMCRGAQDIVNDGGHLACN